MKRFVLASYGAGYPPPAPDADPERPSDAAPAQPTCTPGAQKCVDVTFHYPAAGNVKVTLTP